MDSRKSKKKYFNIYMSKNIEITDKLNFMKKDYEIKTELTNIKLLYVNDERNYITGNLDVKLINKNRKYK